MVGIFGQIGGQHHGKPMGKGFGDTYSFAMAPETNEGRDHMFCQDNRSIPI